MDYKTKSAYIENEITPILMPQGFRYETWEADGDGNGWQYVRGSQKIDIYDKFTYVDMRFMVDYPIRRVVSAKNLSTKELHLYDPRWTFGYDYKTQDDFEGIVMGFKDIICNYGIRKLEELCKPVTDESPIRNMEYFKQLERNRERAVRDFLTTGKRNDSRLELAGLELKISRLSDNLFCDAVDVLIDIAAVYGDWIIRNFGGEWKNNNGILEIIHVGERKATIVPTDDIFKAWSKNAPIAYDDICGKYGNRG